MKVLLINLQSNIRYPSLGCAYILAHLKEKGVAVDFYDLVSDGIKLEHMGQRKESYIDSTVKYAKAVISTSKILKPIKDGLKKFKSAYDGKKTDNITEHALSALLPMISENGYDFILISTAQRFFECVNIMRGIKAHSDVPIIIGGPQFSIDEIAQSWMEEGGIECIGAFEAEKYLYDFLIKHKNNDLDDFKGVWRLKDGAPAFTGRGQLIHDLDSAPFPSFDEYNLAKYPQNVLPILSSRGCAWGRCTFCSDPCVVTNMKLFRKRSPENIISELQNDIEKYGVSKFIFLDEEVNGDINWWRDVLNHIIERGLNIKFVGAFQSTKNIDKEILKLAYKAGYRVIAPGIESGSDRLLKLMKKGTTVRMNENLIISADAVGINVRCAIMYGFPGESVSDLKETLSFLNRNRSIIRKIWLSKFSITVGSPIYNALSWYVKEGLVIEPRYDLVRGQVYFDNPILSDKEYLKYFYELQNLASEINKKGYDGEAKEFDEIL